MIVFAKFSATLAVIWLFCWFMLAAVSIYKKEKTVLTFSAICAGIGWIWFSTAMMIIA